MTRLSRLLLLLYFGVYCGLAYLAAVDLQSGIVQRGLALYAAASVIALAGGREVYHQGAAQAAAIRDGRPRPRTYPSDLDLMVRAELAEHCGCHRSWATTGTDHDLTCPQHPATTDRYEES